MFESRTSIDHYGTRIQRPQMTTFFYSNARKLRRTICHDNNYRGHGVLEHFFDPVTALDENIACLSLHTIQIEFTFPFTKMDDQTNIVLRRVEVMRSWMYSGIVDDDVRFRRIIVLEYILVLVNANKILCTQEVYFRHVARRDNSKKNQILVKKRDLFSLRQSFRFDPSCAKSSVCCAHVVLFSQMNRGGLQTRMSVMISESLYATLLPSSFFVLFIETIQSRHFLWLVAS